MRVWLRPSDWRAIREGGNLLVSVSGTVGLVDVYRHWHRLSLWPSATPRPQSL